MNRVILIGNLGGDPELRHTQGGSAVCNFSIATNEKWKDKNGQLQEHTEWSKIVVWGAQAENCEKYLSKGRQVAVEGKLKTNKWTDNDGIDRWSTEIHAHNVQFLSGGEGGGGDGNGRARRSPPAEEEFDQAFNDDDIPF